MLIKIKVPSQIFHEVSPESCFERTNDVQRKSTSLGIVLQ
jgi:hypothetical protein